jgi:hypothetical protein
MSPEEMDKPLHITQHQCALPRGARRIGRFRDGDIVPINDDDADETEFLELGHPPRNRVELRISEWSLDLDERGAADDRPGTGTESGRTSSAGDGDGDSAVTGGAKDER